jgi:hypothetical protein
MSEPPGKSIALRWIGGHVVGMVALQLVVLALPALDLRTWPSSRLWAGLIHSLETGIRFGAGHLLAIRWAGWPVGTARWGLATFLGVVAGAAVGTQALESILPLITPAFAGKQVWYTPVILAAGTLVFLTTACFLAVPQAVLVGRSLDRTAAIRWGAWTVVAWMAAEFFWHGPIWMLPSDTFDVWPLDERWIRWPVSRAFWAVLFATITLPGIRRLVRSPEGGSLR